MSFSQRESELVDELQAFAGGISADPGLYLLGAPDALTIQTSVDQFLAARVVANTPATRNVGSIDDKDAKKASALGVCRGFYRPNVAAAILAHFRRARAAPFQSRK